LFDLFPRECTNSRRFDIRLLYQKSIVTIERSEAAKLIDIRIQRLVWSRWTIGIPRTNEKLFYHPSSESVPASKESW
jgi:hypothetical protein